MLHRQEAANALLAHAEHVAAIAAAVPGGTHAGLAVAAKEATPWTQCGEKRCGKTWI